MYIEKINGEFIYLIIVVNWFFLLVNIRNRFDKKVVLFGYM